MHSSTNREHNSVELTYPIFRDGEISPGKLPFVVLAMGEFSAGDKREDLKSISAVDCGENVLAALEPSVSTKVPSVLPDADDLAVSLVFRQWQDFSVDAIADRVPELRNWVSVREGLRCLRQTAERNQAFSVTLGQLLKDRDSNSKHADASIHDAFANLISRYRDSFVGCDGENASSAAAYCASVDTRPLARIYHHQTPLLLDALIQDVDTLLSRQLHAVLSDPQIVALTSTWMGFRYLCRTTTGLPDTQVRAVNCSTALLQAEATTDLLHEFINGEAEREGFAPVSQIVADFEAAPDSAQSFADFVEACGKSLVPVIANAAPALVGLQSWEDGNLITLLRRNTTEPTGHPCGEAFARESCKFLALGGPGFLVSRCASVHSARRFRFREAADTNTPVVVRSCWGIAARVAFSSSQQGLPLQAEGERSGALPDVAPIRKWSEDGVPSLQSVLEVPLTIPAIRIFTNCGITCLTELGEQPVTCLYFVPSSRSVDLTDGARQSFMEQASGLRLMHYVIAAIRYGDQSQLKTLDDVLNVIIHYISHYVLDDPHASQEMMCKYPLVSSQIEFQSTDDADIGCLTVNLQFHRRLVTTQSRLPGIWCNSSGVSGRLLAYRLSDTDSLGRITELLRSVSGEFVRTMQDLDSLADEEY